MELLGVFSINKIQKNNSQRIVDECYIIEMNSYIKNVAIVLKQKYKIKLPDAIIAATEIVYEAPLLT